MVNRAYVMVNTKNKERAKRTTTVSRAITDGTFREYLHEHASLPIVHIRMVFIVIIVVTKTETRFRWSMEMADFRASFDGDKRSRNEWHYADFVPQLAAVRQLRAV